MKQVSQSEMLRHNPGGRAWAPRPRGRRVRARGCGSECGRGQASEAPGAVAYPFCLGAHRRVPGVAARSVRQIDLHVVRHFFQKV